MCIHKIVCDIKRHNVNIARAPERVRIHNELLLCAIELRTSKVQTWKRENIECEKYFVLRLSFLFYVFLFCPLCSIARRWRSVTKNKGNWCSSNNHAEQEKQQKEEAAAANSSSGSSSSSSEIMYSLFNIFDSMCIGVCAWERVHLYVPTVFLSVLWRKVKYVIGCDCKHQGANKTTHKKKNNKNKQSNLVHCVVYRSLNTDYSDMNCKFCV